MSTVQTASLEMMNDIVVYNDSVFDAMDIAVKVVIAHNGRFPILLHTARDQWELPGGKVERGEHPVATAMREIREELGIDVSILSMLKQTQRIKENGRTQLVLFFLANRTDPGTTAVIKEPHKHCAIAYPLADLRSVELYCFDGISKNGGGVR